MKPIFCADCFLPLEHYLFMSFISVNSSPLHFTVYCKLDIFLEIKFGLLKGYSWQNFKDSQKRGMFDIQRYTLQPFLITNNGDIIILFSPTWNVRKREHSLWNYLRVLLLILHPILQITITVPSRIPGVNLVLNLIVCH